MKTPAWATRLAARVCMDAGCDVEPDIVWRRKAYDEHSSGHNKSLQNEIVITAGRSVRDQRLTLLHELSHHLGHFDHGDGFYRCLFDLVKRDGVVSLRYAMWSEGDYMAQATRTALAMGLRGAKQAHARSVARRASRAILAVPRAACPVPRPACPFTKRPELPHTHSVGMTILVGGASYRVLPREKKETTRATDPA